MSGRTKRIFYHIADFCLFAGFGIGMFLSPILLRSTDVSVADLLIFAAAALLSFAFALPVLLHECGHLLFGALAGMRPARFAVHWFSAGRIAAGETAMYPKNGERVKGKFFAFTLGGAALDAAVGVTLFLLWLLLPYHPALLLCGTVSGMFFYEGVRALLPAELPAGKTDGAVLLGLLKGSVEEEVALRVLKAQGIVYRKAFSEIPAPLFDAPVVREDLPAYRALLFLKMQWRIAMGGEDGAKELYLRLCSLSDYFAEGESEELARYGDYFAGRFTARKSHFYGVNALEEEMCKKKSAP